MRKKKTRKIILYVFLILCIVYVILTYFLVSACLVPSFMDRLNAFEDITRKCYAEQVQTTAIKENQNRLLKDTARWLETVDRKKLSVQTADGYTLIAAEFTPEQESKEMGAYSAWVYRLERGDVSVCLLVL